ncbi:glycosyltransferase [Mycobacterium intermedium]|uniref:Glycosyltransferase n=1 Tax=Mycobacterium intermedium TaxID=28445 RepID=A0A1E3SGU6_MYCIE|nr:glycosyltransferase family 4 protein [Mycobacterium intermedium]MCV6964551.1 glycosyltransferase family 4 protein [Mycobacterium intermedium]ODR01361.1 glycosyltransferase [Mycobacterium intermedium]OPE52589.1 glycosyltransferase [Mycobacterium intermedium]ORB07496.1 glycosyltransferase [Mycobacterium intermedium]
MRGADFVFWSDGAESARPLRIVMVAPPYFDIPPTGYGGVEAVVADLADTLVARGHHVTVIGAGKGRTAAQFVPLWSRTMPERLGEPYPEVMHALKVRSAIARIAADQGVDVVHDHTFAGPLNAPAYQAMGLPVVATVHGPVDDDLYPYYRELGPDVGLVAISDRQRELAPDLNWVGRVHNALRINDWPYQPDKGDYALFLGRFAPYKGAHLAVQAAHEAGIPLVLAGKCSEPAEKEYFEECVRPLLTDTDHLFGEADAVSKRKLLAEARCLLFPVQWEEPFGIVMIEAMACGTPVVALRGGAVPEVVVDGVTGFVRDDPADLPAAIEQASTVDPQACRHHVATNFDVVRLGSGYERIYRKVKRQHVIQSGTSGMVEPTAQRSLVRELSDKATA